MIPQTNNPNNNISDDFHLSLFETCEMLNKSTRTITRYIKSNILHPRRVKSRKGTLEYRFSESEVEQLREADRISRPYVYGIHHYNPQSYAASFADCNALAQPPAVPFLAPGMSYPVMRGQVFPDPLAAWPQNPPQSQMPGTRESNFPIQQDLPRQKPAAAPLQKNIWEESEESPKKKELPDRASKEIISLLKETTEMLRGQLKTKDDQIKNLDDKIGQLIERNRETNILLKGLQDKIMLLEKPKTKRENEKPVSPAKKEKSIILPLKVETEAAEYIDDANDNSNANTNVNVNTNNPPVPTPPPAADEIIDNVESSQEKKGLFGKIFG